MCIETLVSLSMPGQSVCGTVVGDVALPFNSTFLYVSTAVAQTASSRNIGPSESSAILAAGNKVF
jgi:hypothetical protein